LILPWYQSVVLRKLSLLNGLGSTLSALVGKRRKAEDERRKTKDKGQKMHTTNFALRLLPFILL
jgi:hypothetical protein